MSKFSQQQQTYYEKIETMQHQQQTYYEKIETMQHLYAHIHPHSTLPLDLSSNFDLDAPRKALIAASVSTNSSLKKMEQSDLGAFAPDSKVLIGFLVLHCLYETGHIVNFAVDTPWRRRGAPCA